MKSRNFIFACIFSILSMLTIAQNAWERITPTPQEHSIKDMCKIPGTDKIMAVGSGSTVMTTNDLGETWALQYNPAGMTNNFIGYCIYFWNENIGFISGKGQTILKTLNGGTDWYLAFNGNNTLTSEYKSIYFTSEFIGFAVGVGSIILKTVDGGSNWSEFETGFDIGFNAISFSNPQTGYVVGNSGEHIVKTVNGGETWNLVEFPFEFVYGNLSDIVFVDESVGFIIADNYTVSNHYGMIYKTEDGGVTWIEIYTDIWNIPKDVNFIDENTGIVGCYRVMYESAALVTHNAGESWSESIFTECSSYGAEAVCCNTDNSYLAGGYLGYMYANDGSDWELIHQREFTGDIYQAQVFDEENIYAYSVNGLGGLAIFSLKKSSDGCDSWSNIYMTMMPGVFDFVSPEVGYLVVNDFEFLIKKTVDGGNQWTDIVLTEYSFDPEGCNFKDEMNGMIWAWNILIATSDGGDTWEEVSFAGYFDLVDVEYVGANTILVLVDEGPNAKIHISNDNGATWENIAIIENVSPRGLYLTETNTIFLTSYNSIWKSTDQGESWIETTVNSTSNFIFNSIHFPTDQIGYAVGDGSYKTTFKSTDGGNTWNELDINSTSTLNHVHFFNEDYGLVFGENGLVMRTTTGGIVGAEEETMVSKKNNLWVYPNPFDDEIIIQTGISLQWQNTELHIYNINGDVVHHSAISSSEEIKIEVDFLYPGIYFIQLNNKSGVVETKKIIKH